MLERVTLQGPNVALSPLEQAHVPGLVQAAQENRAPYRYLAVPSDAASMQAYVDAAETARAAGSALPFAIVERESGRVLGATRFRDIEHWPWPADHPLRRVRETPDVVEIGGTWLAASALGRGIHRESSSLLLTYAFEAWRVRRVALRCDARDERARRAIEKLGVRFDGVLRAACIAADGAVLDVATYSVLDMEWRSVRAGLARSAEPSHAPAR